MTTQSASRQTAVPLGRRTGGRTGRGGRRTAEPTCRVSGRTGDQDGQGGDRGIGENVGADEVHDFSTVIAQQLQDPLPNIIGQVARSKFWCHTMVESSHAAYTFQFDELARLVPHLVTIEKKRIKRYIYAFTPQIRTIVRDVLKDGMLNDEEIRNGLLEKNTKKRGYGEELSRDGNVRDENKRSRTGRTFATITNPVRKEYTGTAPKCTNCSFHRNPEMPFCKCTNCNHLENFAKDYRARPRMVTLLNARKLTIDRGACFKCSGTDHYKAACPSLNRAPRQGAKPLNQTMDIEGDQCRGNNGNQARGGAFRMGA
uniref:CCHC-type domain-containing protein n=1 Tax=Tanacetum cinerariifolium TaxID=118510 RepID=A0A6L2LGR4_TANCI|nr:hypothetical protein [Tanacetum cinerariifolium]